MKKIKLPVGCRVSIKLDPRKVFGHNPNPKEPIASITVNHDAFNTAQENGAQIVYAAATIERKFETMILHYFFGPTVGVPKPEKELFDSEVLQSDRITYSFKKQILKKIIEKYEFLTPQDKDSLQKDLSKIMRWRNAFAHGQLMQNDDETFHLSFYSNGQQSILLNNVFWTEIEECFMEAQKLMEKLDANFSGWLIERYVKK